MIVLAFRFNQVIRFLNGTSACVAVVLLLFGDYCIKITAVYGTDRTYVAAAAELCRLSAARVTAPLLSVVRFKAAGGP